MKKIDKRLGRAMRTFRENLDNTRMMLAKENISISRISDTCVCLAYIRPPSLFAASNYAHFYPTNISKTEYGLKINDKVFLILSRACTAKGEK